MSATRKTDDIASCIALHRPLELPDIGRATVERTERFHPPPSHLCHHRHRFSAITRVLNANFNVNPDGSVRINKNSPSARATANNYETLSFHSRRIHNVI
jgi:hypothetical protein